MLLHSYAYFTIDQWFNEFVRLLLLYHRVATFSLLPLLHRPHSPRQHCPVAQLQQSDGTFNKTNKMVHLARSENASSSFVVDDIVNVYCVLVTRT